MEKASRIGYMCATDFDHELGEAPGGIEVYRSKEDCLAHRTCVKGCGMVKVKVIFEKRILKGSMARMISDGRKANE